MKSIYFLEILFVLESVLVICVHWESVFSKLFNLLACNRPNILL